MDTSLFLSELETLGTDMIEVVQSTPLDAAVPTCPGWDLRDLALHTGFVWLHKAEAVRGDWQAESPPWPQTPEAEASIDDVASWFEAAFDEMVEVFSSADLNEPRWTWCPHEHNADWWVRRMAHETLIHGIDASVAAGRPTPPVSPLGADGVDELLDELLAGAPDWADITPGDQTIRLEGANRRWDLRTMTWSGTSTYSGTTYTDEPGFIQVPAPAVDATILADPLILDVWLWGRGGLPDGAVRGESELADRLRSVAAAATQ